MTDITKVTIAAVDQASEVLARVQSSFQRLQDSYTKMAAVFGVGLSVAGLLEFANSTIDAIAKMQDLAEIAGTTAEAMSKFEAPTRVAGASLDVTAEAMAKMSRAAIAALNPLSAQGQAFASIGISTQQLRTLAPDQLFELIARQLDKYSDGIQKNAVMQQIFSKSGFDLNSIMKQIAATTELHASVTQKDAEQAKAFQEEVVRLKMASEGFWRGIASDWVPALTRLITTFKEATEGAGLFKTALIGIAGIFGGDVSTVDNVIEHFATTFKTRLQDMRDAFDNLGAFKDVLLVMMGIPPTTVAAVQQANSTRGGIPGQTLVRGSITPAYTFYGEGYTGVSETVGAAKPAPNFDPYAAAQAAKAANDLNNALAKIMATESGLAADFGRDMAIITEGFVTGQLSASDYGKAIDALIAQQPAYKAALKAQADEMQRLFTYMKAMIDLASQAHDVNAQASVDASDQSDELEFQISLIGKTSTEIEKLTAARQIDLDLMRQASQIGSADQDSLTDAQAAELSALVKTAQARKENVAGLIDEKAAAESQLAVWSQLGDMAGRFFSDLVQHGRSAFDSLRNMVKQLLADMIALFAKRWILNLAAGGSLMGSAGSALAGGTGSDSLAGSVLSYGSTALGLTSAVMGGAASYAGAGMVASGMGVSAVADSMAINAAAGTAATSGVMSGVMSGVTSALSSIPVYGWIALAVIAIAAWLGGKGGGPKTGGSFFGAFDSSANLTGTPAVPGTDNGRFFTPNQADAQMQQATQSFATGYLAAFKQLGGTNASALTAGLGIDNDPHGTAQSRVSSMLQMGGSTIFSATNVGVDDKAVPAEVQHQMDQMLLAALQNSDLPPEVEKILHTISDVASASDDQIKTVLSQAQEMAGVLQGLKSLNLNVTVEDLQAMAASGETIGQTFQRVATEIGQFDAAFMTDGQKLDAAHKQITDTFGALGISIPKTSEEFYNLVHGLDLSTESGRNAFDALMKVAPAFQAVEQAGVAMTSALTSALSTLGNSSFGRSMTQGTISNAASQFRATHPFAAGWSDSQLVSQLQTISPADWANYLSNDPSGASLITTILTAAASLASSAAPAASSFSSAVGNAASAASNLAAQLDQAKGSLGQYLDSLMTDKNLSPLSPLDQQEAARQVWVKDLQAAAAGDAGAYQRVQGDATNLLTIARANYGSSSQYVDLFKAVFDQMSILSGTDDYNTRMVKIGEAQSGLLSDIKALLISIRDKGDANTGAVIDATTQSADVVSGTMKNMTVTRR